MQMQPVDRTQVRYSRITGFMFLFIIVVYMTGQFMLEGILGSGTFGETVERVHASELQYRLGLGLWVVSAVSTVLLAFSLYAALRPVDTYLAQMAMYWRMGESFMGGVMTMVAFTRLSLYVSPSYAEAYSGIQLSALVDLTRSLYSAGFNISTLFFSVGSTIFFYLFLRSGYIPKFLSLFGIFASLMVVLTGFGNLILPQYGNVIQYGWLPMFISEIATGFWLLIVGVREPKPTSVTVA